MALASTATSGVLNDVGDLPRAQVIDHENYFRGNVTACPAELDKRSFVVDLVGWALGQPNKTPNLRTSFMFLNFRRVNRS